MVQFSGQVSVARRHFMGEVAANGKLTGGPLPGRNPAWGTSAVSDG